jgi:membrane associated rhomboid family serine protease
MKYFRKKQHQIEGNSYGDYHNDSEYSYEPYSEEVKSVRWGRNRDDLGSIVSAGDAESDEEEIYIVQQRWGYCSILFSVAQTIILGLMMWQCGIAPLSLNPMIGPYPDALSEWGGKNAILIISDNEWYRLITPIMLHAGIFHLLGNVAVQLETGVFFEREWGSIRWLIVYLGSAVGSTVFSVIVMPNAVSVGSSGAVMGLFGGKLAEVMLRCCERQITKQDRVAATVRKEQCCVVTFSVIIVMAFSFIPFVDWAAHLGGLVAGFVIGLALFSFAVQGCYGIWKIVWLSLGLAAASALFIGAITYMYSGQVEAAEELRDVCGYYKENFENYQCNCMRAEYVQNGGN